MANPSPQHNPTDGLNTATRITLTSNDGNFATVVAGRVYLQPLSVSGATINGTAYGATAALTAALKDVSTNVFTSGNANSVTWRSYNTAQATVSAGTVTSVAPGQAIIEARFPTFDTTDTTDFIYVQIICQIYP